MDSRPIFSVIIPTFYHDAELEECLEALSAQTTGTDRLEVIVVDDSGRTDIVRTAPGRGPRTLDVRYLIQDHRGPARARNLGIRQARGDVIVLLDDDSLPIRNWLAALAQAWEKYPESDGIGGLILSSPEEGLCCRVSADIFNWFVMRHSDGRGAGFLCTCNASYKRAILERVGLFDEGFARPAGEDRDLNIRIRRSEGRLRLETGLLVHHDRDLRLASFAKKYFHYGRAAFEIARRYPDVLPPSRRSYLDLFLSAFRAHRFPLGTAAALALLALSQAATLAGYASARLRPEKRPEPQALS